MVKEGGFGRGEGKNIGESEETTKERVDLKMRLHDEQQQQQWHHQ